MSFHPIAAGPHTEITLSHLSDMARGQDYQVCVTTVRGGDSMWNCLCIDVDVRKVEYPMQGGGLLCGCSEDGRSNRSVVCVCLGFSGG